MNQTRQDAWSKDEDILLAETVLRYIREGKTQLAAFKEVAKQLSRTSSACGFRWNASIRKDYQQAIDYAKEERKKNGRQKILDYAEQSNTSEQNPIDTAILALEKMRNVYSASTHTDNEEANQLMKQLEQENKSLKAQLHRYEQAWQEMGKLWEWVNETN